MHELAMLVFGLLKSGGPLDLKLALQEVDEQLGISPGSHGSAPVSGTFQYALHRAASASATSTAESAVCFTNACIGLSSGSVAFRRQSSATNRVNDGRWTDSPEAPHISRRSAFANDSPLVSAAMWFPLRMISAPLRMSSSLFFIEESRAADNCVCVFDVVCSISSASIRSIRGSNRLANLSNSNASPTLARGEGSKLSAAPRRPLISIAPTKTKSAFITLPPLEHCMPVVAFKSGFSSRDNA